MKTSLSRITIILILGGALLAPLHAGTEILLYPLARAFGSPPESELARCRSAFQRLQSRLETSRVAVAPVFLVDGGRREWRPDLAALLVRTAGAGTAATLGVSSSTPAVAPARLGHNQLRYLWERAAIYSAWVQAVPPVADYVWLVEIWGHDGKVGAIHVFVLDARGQVAYCRLYNSHQFGPDLPMAGDAALRLLVRQLFEDLTKAPEKIFPPYGVG